MQAIEKNVSDRSVYMIIYIICWPTIAHQLLLTKESTGMINIAIY